MPKATMKLTVLVTLDVPAEYAAKVTREDLINMARSAVPDSLTHPDPANGRGGPCDGTQVTVEDVCQEEGDQPVFADVNIEHDQMEDVGIEFEDEGFTKAEGESD